MGFTKKNVAMAAAAALVCGSAAASEDYDLRYAPGVGGADMSAPFEGGWVFQSPVFIYNAKVDNSATQAPQDLTALGLPGATVTSTINSRTVFQIKAVLPRLSYMSQTKFLGAQVGGTIMVPIVSRKVNTTITGIDNVFTPALPPAVEQLVAGGVAAGAGALAKASSNTGQGLGDVEASPILRWSTDNTQLLLIATVVAPTGDYEASKAANAGAGHFWTFRPAVQYSYIGDGWDFGGRAAFSINTTNSKTHYKTGDYLNLDAVFMKSINDSLRVGAAAYAVMQTTSDKQSQPFVSPDTSATGLFIDQVVAAREAPTLDQKGHVFGLGPEIAYIKGAGDYLLDGRIMKEFGADTRPQGYAVWMTFSKPF